MRRVPVWTLLPMILLAACQSTSPSQSAGQRGGASATAARVCPPRLQDAGQCGTAGIYSFPELANVR